MDRLKKNSSDRIHIDVENLRTIIREILNEVTPRSKKAAAPLPSGKISASSDYMKSEDVMTFYKQILSQKISSEEITDQKQLDRWFKDSMMSLQALKMIPLEVLKKNLGIL